MAYSVLLIGAATPLGLKVSQQLALRTYRFSKVAVLTPHAVTDSGTEAKSASPGLEHVDGSYAEPGSYKGFDIVVCTLEDGLCAKQREYFDAAVAGGVKHFYPAECEPRCEPYSIH